MGVLSARFKSRVIPPKNKNRCQGFAGIKQAAATQMGYKGNVLQIPAEGRMVKEAAQASKPSKSI